MMARCDLLGESAFTTCISLGIVIIWVLAVSMLTLTSSCGYATLVGYELDAYLDENAVVIFTELTKKIETHHHQYTGWVLNTEPINIVWTGMVVRLKGELTNSGKKRIEREFRIRVTFFDQQGDELAIWERPLSVAARQDISSGESMDLICVFTNQSVPDEIISRFPSDLSELSWQVRYFTYKGLSESQ